MEEKEQLTPQTENTAAEVAPKAAENVSPAAENNASECSYCTCGRGCDNR